MKFFIPILLVFTFWSCSIHSQPTQKYSSENKKALKLFEKAFEKFNEKSDELAEIYLKEAIEEDPKFVEAYELLGTIYEDHRDYDKAKDIFKKGIEATGNAKSAMSFSVAMYAIHKGEYQDAKKYAELFIKSGNDNRKMVDGAIKIKVDAEFAMEAIKNPVNITIKNMGQAINSDLNEYFPCVSADNETFIYTRRLKSKQNPTGFNEDFYISKAANGEWQPSMNMGGGINTPYNEGAPSLSPNGQLLIFTACELYGNYGENRTGYGSCDLFFSQWDGEKWSLPKNMGKTVNSGNWESQPSFSPDGRTVYFVRGNYRNGPYTNDIYKSELGDNGYWSTPEKLSDKVNTPFREEYVQIHPDGKTLYFSSDGHPGMGGLDIFMSKMDENGEWQTPINLGYPINTYNDESSLLVAADGELAYFSSDKEGGFGGLDLYSFVMPEHLRPEKITYLKGKLLDAEIKKPVEGKFEIVDVATQKVVTTSWANAAGEFLVCLTAGYEYALSAEATGYLFHSENFEFTSSSIDKPVEKNILLKPIKEGEEIALRNIFFESNKYDLLPKSIAELEKLKDFLTKNPNVKIEIGGHTDNVGSDKDNLTLSQNRAKAVMDYLINNGIAKERLTSKGYGETKPIADNNTEEGKALNRRTVMKVVGK